MAHPQRRLLLSLAVCAGLSAPIHALANDSPAGLGISLAQETHSAHPLEAPALAIDPSSVPVDATPSDPLNNSDKPMLTLAGTGPSLHGFGDFRICTQYITPRGLVAEEDSPQFQVLLGLVFDFYSGDGFINDAAFIFGAWSDFNTHPDKSKVTGADVWTEADIFLGVDVKFAKNWDAAYTIQAWTFPDFTEDHVELDPSTEWNMDLKISYDDTDFLHQFALHPYVDVFWNFCGDSSPVAANVLLGKNNHTFYVELGIGPSYTWKVSPDWPITFTMPTYFSFGDSSFWGETPSGDRSNLGVFSTGLKISTPLKFIPQTYGNWNAYVGVTYYHTCNPALTFINSGTGADANLVLGYAGVGFNF